ncbi:MAG TPA: Tim44/TimA family putative adaptor protein [Hyphomicrobiaceae bacterium]|nr:Tim44/TimA family putative adaptor protein [Hyphomicrobiaceae bacterium]
MPQETDATALVSVLSVIWLYWIVSSWIEYFQGLARGQGASQEQPSVMYAASEMPPSAGAAACLSLDGFASASLQREAATAIDDLLARVLPLYETIVTAFDAGDRATLRILVEPDVYRTFSDAIAGRAEDCELETVFSRLEPPEIVDVALDAMRLQVSLRLVGEAFRLSRDAAGRVREKSPRPRRNVDEWTFARDLSSRNSVWYLAATGVAD